MLAFLDKQNESKILSSKIFKNIDKDKDGKISKK
jgi:hypothetical protein